MSTKPWPFILVLALAACDRAATIAGLPPSTIRLDQPLSEVVDGWGAWSTPVNMSAVNSSAADLQATMSPDGLSLYFASGRPGGMGANDLWVSRRSSRDSEWQTPVHLGAQLNSVANDAGPAFSQDGHLLFFHSARSGGQGAVDIYVSHRENLDDDFSWSAPVNLGTDVNTSEFEAGAMYMPQLETGRVNLYFGRGPDPTSIDMYSVAIGRDGSTLGPAESVLELDFFAVGVPDAHPTIRGDGREIYFFSSRPGGFGGDDLYRATRQSIHSAWSAPVNLGAPFNTASRDSEPSLSWDGTTLFFASNRPGGLGAVDIWISTRSHGHMNP